MGKRKAILATVVIVAIAAVVYFGFFFPPPRGEDLSGTIGAVRQYRAEQITDQDVVLEGQEGRAATE
jgi:hypothetical protein